MDCLKFGAMRSTTFTTASPNASRFSAFHPPVMFDRFACNGDQLAYFPVFPPPVGFDTNALWYDSTRRQWDALPGLDSIGYPGEPQIAELNGIRIAWIGGNVATDVIGRPAASSEPTTRTRLVPAVPPTQGVSMPATDGQLFVLRSGTTQWLRPKPPIPGPVGLAVLDHLILVIPSERHDVDHMAIGLLDPRRLPGVAK